MDNVYRFFTPVTAMTNQYMAKKLIDLAHRLEAQKAGLYRVRAYRRAAETILALDRPLTDIVAEKGRSGLLALPGIGPRLSRTLQKLLKTSELHPRGVAATAGQPSLPYHGELSDACQRGS